MRTQIKTQTFRGGAKLRYVYGADKRPSGGYEIRKFRVLPIHSEEGPEREVRVRDGSFVTVVGNKREAERTLRTLD
jgi:hypothetical protein